MARRLAITKKVSLAGIGEGWGDECYAVIALASNREQFEIADTDTATLTNRQSIDIQATFVKDHFIRGEVKVFGSDGSLKVVGMTSDDVEDNTEIASRLFLACVGSDIDPKDIPEGPSLENEQPSATATTETSSSTV